MVLQKLDTLTHLITLLITQIPNQIESFLESRFDGVNLETFETYYVIYRWSLEVASLIVVEVGDQLKPDKRFSLLKLVERGLVIINKFEENIPLRIGLYYKFGCGIRNESTLPSISKEIEFSIKCKQNIMVLDYKLNNKADEQGLLLIKYVIQLIQSYNRVITMILEAKPIIRQQMLESQTVINTSCYQNFADKFCMKNIDNIKMEEEQNLAFIHRKAILLYSQNGLSEITQKKEWKDSNKTLLGCQVDFSIKQGQGNNLDYSNCGNCDNCSKCSEKKKIENSDKLAKLMNQLRQLMK